MESKHSHTTDTNILELLALLTGTLLAISGILNLTFGRWWIKEPMSTSSSKGSLPLNREPLTIPAAIEVIASIAVIYRPFRLLAASVLICNVAFSEINDRRKAAETESWKLRALRLVEVVGLLVIVGFEGGRDGVISGWKYLSEAAGSWGMRRWAGLEEREVGIDF